MQPKCATCRWFKPVEEGRFMSGGWCDWRAPMRLRHMLWGAHNQRIENPETEWCAEHQPAPTAGQE